MLPVKRVMASASRSCQPLAFSSSRRRASKASMFRPTTAASRGCASRPVAPVAAMRRPLSSRQAQPPPVVGPVAGAPVIFVVFPAAEEIELPRAFAGRLLDGVADRQQAGAEALQRRVEAAQVEGGP